MAIYAISDLHLSFGCDKPMDIFGGNWENHSRKLVEKWHVDPGDTVLIPGDISWAMSLETVEPDLAFIEALPGRKIISKGNHDYWWCTRGKFEKFTSLKGFNSIKMLFNNAYSDGPYSICGTRGWISKDDPDFSEEDLKVYDREIARLRLSLDEAGKTGGAPIAMLHYPPFDSSHRLNDFASVLKEYDVKTCVYGHIHGRANPSFRDENVDGIRFMLISADFLDFEPVRIA